ncbi:MAG: hypothetical protein V4508_25635 [Pseudomonadota bacterium]
MKRPTKLRTRLLAPLIYLAALLLMLEDWFWDLGARLIALVASWPPLRALERRVQALPPYGALAVFVLPGVLLFPVKLLALLAITRGHAIYGVSVIVIAKIGGAAIVARLYSLTRPTLLRLAWFARWHNAFMALKDRWIGRLKASDAYRRTSRMAARMRAAVRRLLLRLRPRARGRLAMRPARMLRRFIAMWRARR